MASKRYPPQTTLGPRTTGRRVPLARRQLSYEPLKLVLALSGVTLSVALVGLLFGLREGIERQVTTFVDHAGAQVYVAPRDTRSFVTGGPPALPAALARQIQRAPGVQETGAVVSDSGAARIPRVSAASDICLPTVGAGRHRGNRDEPSARK